jgi:hypothetical protein
MGEVFDTEVASTVKLSVNGTPKGDVSFTPGTTLNAFVVTQARLAGIRTFSVYVDGDKLNTEDASDPIEAGVQIEIVAKDSRG